MWVQNVYSMAAGIYRPSSDQYWQQWLILLCSPSSKFWQLIALKLSSGVARISQQIVVFNYGLSFSERVPYQGMLLASPFWFFSGKFPWMSKYVKPLDNTLPKSSSELKTQSPSRYSDRIYRFYNAISRSLQGPISAPNSTCYYVTWRRGSKSGVLVFMGIELLGSHS